VVEEQGAGTSFPDTVEGPAHSADSLAVVLVAPHAHGQRVEDHQFGAKMVDLTHNLIDILGVFDD
jgi:hypothetical protein